MSDIIMMAKPPNMPGDNSFYPFSAKEFELFSKKSIAHELIQTETFIFLEPGVWPEHACTVGIRTDSPVMSLWNHLPMDVI